MRKKDPIFWAAAAIFVASCVIAALTREQLWFFLAIVSYLLRPTLASLGVARRYVDERQMSLQYRSGNVAFAVMIVACVVLAVIQSAKGDQNWDLFNIAIALGLAAKALFNVLLTKNYREAASRIIMAVGLLATLFVAAENGVSLAGLIEASPFIGIVVIGWLARRYPRTVGAAIIVVGGFFLFQILWNRFTLGQFATALLVCGPLFTAGACLFMPEQETTTEEGTP